MARVWTKESVRENLEKNDAWVIRALVALYHRQTEDEKVSHHTKHQNGAGFTAFDAEILTSFAKQVENWDKDKYPRPLSPKQMLIARKRVLKYSGQLANIANKEA